MKVAVMQPYFLPYIGYWQLLSEVDHFVLYDDVNFIKKGYVNRNNLLINGMIKSFTIPLIKASQNRLISEIEVDSNQKWRQKLLKMILLSYKKAPYFGEIYELLEEVINSEYNLISEIIVLSIQKVSSYLMIDVEISVSSQEQVGIGLKGQRRILEICKSKKGTHYINPIGGIEIYDNAFFQEEGIELSFISTSSKIKYKQLGKGEEFINNLSIIDVLMNNSREEVIDLLKQFTLTTKS